MVKNNKARLIGLYGRLTNFRAVQISQEIALLFYKIGRKTPIPLG
jgi:hypothetical protein